MALFMEMIVAVGFTVLVLVGVASWTIWGSLTPREKWSIKDNMNTLIERLKP